MFGAVSAPLFSVMDIDIEKIVEGVISTYERNNTNAQCDLHDIFRMIEDDIKSEMRRLIKEGKYQGSITINKIPVLRRKE